jgi:hypothetical protein
MDFFINPQKEFLAVRHSYLNGNNLNLEHAVEETLALEKYTCGRKIVPCFEADLLQVQETKEVVLTHQNFIPLSQKKYQEYHEKSIATSLVEALEKVAAYKQKNPEQRIVVCLELKPITARETIEKAVALLKEHDFGYDEAYFDSFYGEKLDQVRVANQLSLVPVANRLYRINYSISLHLLMNFAGVQFQMTKLKHKPEVITVPKKISFGHPGMPVIYGAMGSVKKLEEIAQDQQVVGAYLRFREGNMFRMLWDSVTNTQKLRRFYLL